MSRMKGMGIKSPAIKCLIVVYSYHHNNTAKIAQVFSEVLNAQILTPDQVTQEELQQYNLIGFGSGIDSGKHYKPILNLVDGLSKINNKRSFIFSTSALQGEAKVEKDHSLLREKLTAKGFTVVDEFSCKGFNTNSFIKYFGGMNKGRPNRQDLKHAEEFAFGLVQKLSSQNLLLNCLEKYINEHDEWYKINSETYYEDELYKEVSDKHILFGKKCVAVAKRDDCDDILFLVQNSEIKYAIVHLTWNSGLESHSLFPMTRTFCSIEELIEDRN